MIRSLFILVLTFSCLGSFCQDYFNKRFEFDLSGVWDGATNIFLMPDGYIIGGATGSPGNEFWYRIGFCKVDFQGNILFNRLIGDSYAEYFIGNPGSIVRINDSIIITSGGKRRHTTNWVHDEGLLCFHNNDLDTLFCIYFGEKQAPYDTSYSFRQVKKDFGNNFVIVGTKKPYGIAEKILLMKTDQQGTLIREKTYGTASYCQGHSVICTSDSGYAIGGLTWFPTGGPNYTGDPVIVKTDSSGNQEWFKVLGGSCADTRGMLCSTSDGNMVLGYCICDWMNGSNSFRRINLIKLNNAGDIIWNKKYGVSTYGKTLFYIREDPDGSLISTGITHVSREYSSKDLGWILKTTTDGDSLWYREFGVCNGDESNNWLYDVIQTQDNGYLACGVVYPMPPDTGSQDGWILKVDSLGCTAPGECWVGQEEIEVREFTPDKPFVFYPNPVNEKLTIEFHENPAGAEIELFDLTCRKTVSAQIVPNRPLIELDVGKLSTGLYILKVTMPGKMPVMGKVVVE